MADSTNNALFLETVKEQFINLRRESFYGKFLDPRDNCYKLAVCSILWKPEYQGDTIEVENSLQDTFEITAEPYVKLFVLDKPFVEGAICFRNYPDEEFTKYFMLLSDFISCDYNEEIVRFQMLP